MNTFSVVLAGHGSRDSASIEECDQLVARMRESAPPNISIELGYLEFAKPSISDAINKVVRNGSKQIIVVPALLTAATHAKNDMPAQLDQFRTEFSDCDIRFAGVTDLHPALLDLCRERIVTAESTMDKLISRRDTCLVVVGRGTNDPDANSDIYKLARLLEEGMQFGGSFTCFSGTAKPLVLDGIKRAARLGFKRLLVLPFMLFDGTLVKRIYAAAEAVARRNPELDVVAGNYLGPHPMVAQVFLERAEQALHGLAPMNCTLCKFRVPIVGYEHQCNGPLATALTKQQELQPYKPHPIEKQSFEHISAGRDWTSFTEETLPVAQRIVHTAGDLSAADDLFFSPGAVATGVMSLLRCKRVVTDVTMVASGLKRQLLADLDITVWCGVHDRETVLLAQSNGLTRSAAGIRRAWQLFGNDVVLAIGDAPTAIFEALQLVREANWRPQLIVGLPVGFIGTVESKQALRDCLSVPRITNTGNRGGSPWASAVINAILIAAMNRAANMDRAAQPRPDADQ